MNLYTAIIDDTAANRKHLERLIEREGSARLKQIHAQYVDSYGNEKPLMSAAAKYDIIFINMIHNPTSEQEIAHALRHAGISCPLVLFLSEAVNQECLSALPNIFYMRTPFVQEQLGQMLDKAIALKASQTVKIELRTKEDTYYVTSDEIIMAQQDAHLIRIYMSNARSLEIICSMEQFLMLLKTYSCFIPIHSYAVVNAAHITEVHNRIISLKEAHTVTVPLFQMHKFRKKLALYSLHLESSD